MHLDQYLIYLRSVDLKFRLACFEITEFLLFLDQTNKHVSMTAIGLAPTTQSLR